LLVPTDGQSAVYFGLSQTAPKHHSDKHLLTFSCSCCCWGYSLGSFSLCFSSHRIMSCSRTFLFELFHVSAHFLRLQKWGGQRSGAVVTSTACCIGIIGKDLPIKQHKQKSRGNAQKWLKNDPLPLGSRLIVTNHIHSIWWRQICFLMKVRRHVYLGIFRQ